MLFSSLLFLYLFLPLTLLGYYLSPHGIKNYWLLLTSLIFFAWGGVSLTALLLTSITLNYFFGILIQKNIESQKSYWWTFTGVTVNVLLLGVYKYGNFIIHSLNDLFEILSIPLLPQSRIILPIGISFYTFHSLSYLVDIYRRKTLAQKNIFDLALYISMFSQLIAGPIIRYSDVWAQLKGRKHTVAKFSSGVERFLIGLGKKVLLANTFAKVADSTFNGNIQNLDAMNAWFGIACYTFQLYCDFSGYSDMAIGLGRMFGFEFKENFNFPFISKSVTEFWRRWHISLSSWFNDYVFTPLVIGKRDWNKGAVVYALLVTFFLCGLWHGAGWNFALYGLMHGIVLVLEFLTKKTRKKISGFLPEFIVNGLAIFLTLSFVSFSWIFFRANTIEDALNYCSALFRPQSNSEQLSMFVHSFDRELLLTFSIAALGSFGFFNWIYTKSETLLNSDKRSAVLFSYGYHLASFCVYGGIIFLCTLYLVAGTYNPFIYFRF